MRLFGLSPLHRVCTDACSTGMCPASRGEPVLTEERCLVFSPLVYFGEHIPPCVSSSIRLYYTAAKMGSLTQSWMSPDYPLEPYDGPPRNVAFIDNLSFDPKLQPKQYDIAGTPPGSKILILDVNVLDATGAQPYRGDVLIIGK